MFILTFHTFLSFQSMFSLRLVLEVMNEMTIFIIESLSWFFFSCHAFVATIIFL